MGDDIGKKTRSSMYWNLSFKIPYEVFRFGISIVVARLLDPRDFGIVSIATMIIFYSNTLTNLGFKSALVQRKEITDEHISSVFTADLAISCVMACLFYFLAPLIAGFFHAPESIAVIRVMSLTFILTTFYDLPYTLFRRDLNFKVISLVDTAKEVLMSVITVVLAIYGFQYWSIVWGQLVALTLAALFLMVKARRKPRLSRNVAALKDLFNYGIWSFVRTQLAFFSGRMDRLIVGRYLGMSVLGGASEPVVPRGIIDMILQSSGIMMRRILQLQLREFYEYPLILIEPQSPTRRLFDFDETGRSIQAGERAALNVLRDHPLLALV